MPVSAAERAVLEERATVYEGMKPHIEALGRGERLTVEQRADFDAREKQLQELDAELATTRAAGARADIAAAAAAQPAAAPGEDREGDFSAYLRRGEIAPSMRAAQGEATGGAGGYLVPPGFWQNLQVALKAYGGIAKDFRPIMTDSGAPMQWPTVDPTGVVGSLLTENTQVQDQPYQFAQGLMSAYTYTSGVTRVSVQLTNDSAFDVDEFVTQRIGEAIGRAQAQAVISGTGSAQPTGIVTALAARGNVAAGGSGGLVPLTAGQKVQVFGDTAGANSTEIKNNTISPQTALKLIASVDPAYYPSAAFYVNQNQLIGLRSQVDANGRPLLNLQDGISQGFSAVMFGFPVKLDQNIPDLTASTAGGPIFGALNAAMVLRTVNQGSVMRLTERYADFLEVGFIGFVRFDSVPNDLRAAAGVLAAAT